MIPIKVKDLYFLSVIVTIQLANQIGFPLLKERIVEAIASAANRFSKNKRQQMESNLYRAFADRFNPEQRRKVIKGAFYEFWRSMFSLLPCRAEKDALGEIEVKGIEHLHAALKNGKGVILWESNGFGSRVVAKQVLHARGYCLHQVHGKNNLGGFLVNDTTASWVRRWIKRSFNSWEREFISEIIDLPETNSLAFTRVLSRLLSRNAILCISGDGKTGHNFVRLHFLGRAESFATGIVSLSMISGAAILPMFCVRGRNRQRSVVIECSIDLQVNRDRQRRSENGIGQYIKLLEGYICRYPEQYRNWHLMGPANNVSRARFARDCQ